MHHYTTHPRGALSALRPLSAEVTVRGETGTMPRPRSLRRPCAAAPPFARRGPSGRFPRVVALTAALRLLTAHRAALRCLRARATAAIQQPETMRSPKFLGHPLVRTCPGSSTPAEPREQDLRDRQSLRIAPPVLPSETTDSSASTTDLSGPNSAAHALAVYASWSRSPVCFLNDHARLASGWRSCLGRTGFLPAGSRNQVSARVGSTWLPPGRGFSWRTVANANGFRRARGLGGCAQHIKR